MTTITTDSQKLTRQPYSGTARQRACGKDQQHNGREQVARTQPAASWPRNRAPCWGVLGHEAARWTATTPLATHGGLCAKRRITSSVVLAADLVNVGRQPMRKVAAPTRMMAT